MTRLDTVTAHARRREGGGELPAAAAALRCQLERLREVIGHLPPGVYQSSPSPVSGSIGAHVRHCLDHIRALLTHRAGTTMTYDARLRGTGIEIDPAEASAEIDRLRAALAELDAARLAEPIVLRTVTDRQGAATDVETTVGRELAFVVQHTIHHAAIIGVLLDRAGWVLPPDFGYAPTTPRERQLAAAS